MTLGDPGRDGAGLGSGASYASAGKLAYVCSSDIVELLERVDEMTDQYWRVVTLDRTANGEYYAFLEIPQGL